MTTARHTPVMRQYLDLKEKHPDAILLFRMGDFYEMFFEDAEVAAGVLDLALTTRDKGKPDAIPMAGFPWHAADGYIAKLVRSGHRVAVGEQLSDPAQSKGIVDRGIVEIVTPGTAVQDSLVREKENSYVAALLPGGRSMGFAAADVSTGELLVDELPPADWLDAVSSLTIREWLLPEGLEATPGFELLDAKLKVVRPSWWFESARGERELRSHLGVRSLSGYGCDDLPVAWGASGALLNYVRETRGGAISHLVRLQRLGIRDYMQLDKTTSRNLELIIPLTEGAGETTLISVLDKTCTGMGSRKLRAWLQRPLLDRDRIVERHDAVQELIDRPELHRDIQDLLGGFRDLERLLAKVVANKASPRDLLALGRGAECSPRLEAILSPLQSALWSSYHVPDLGDLGRRVLGALADDPPLSVGDGGVFRTGWDEMLDELQGLATGGKAWIASLQETERQTTGIAKLKVGYNRVFGYYLEIGKSQNHKVPDHYTRKQTLTNAERYVTPELKEVEAKILSAEEKLRIREITLFQELRGAVLECIDPIQLMASILAETDVLSSLAEVAKSYHYSRPLLVREQQLKVLEGRHPVVERMLGSRQFVPNDFDLNFNERQIGVITGPNMSGKSTYLRQAALIVIMAQMGSFVPADHAEMGVFDRVFTRVGASDSIARGQSTFLVEMEETAAILNGATDRSLVFLDEVGRGTSTYDGLSLAWAVTEYLHECPRGAPLTLFATHYHELTDLADLWPRVFNLNVQVKEWNDTVIFLHKIVPGSADKSYGIHVAEMAGIPDTVLNRAGEILRSLEQERTPAPHTGNELQLTLFEPAPDTLADELAEMDVDALTPIQALNLVHSWKKRNES